MARQGQQEEFENKRKRSTFKNKPMDNQSYWSLIKILVKINRVILEGIFDTRSNINIISKDAWQRTS